jgi:hypothetical protein
LPGVFSLPLRDRLLRWFDIVVPIITYPQPV